MPVYFVSYDLDKPGQNYDNLYAALHQLNGKRVLYSQWVVQAKGPATALRDWLRPHIDVNDRLLVQDRDGGNWASWNLMADPNQF